MPSNTRPTLVPNSTTAKATGSARATTTGVVKATAGTLCNITIHGTPSAWLASGGHLALNNSATLGGASAANVVLQIPASGLTDKQLVAAYVACSAGIVVSSIPTGMIAEVAFA